MTQPTLKDYETVEAFNAAALDMIVSHMNNAIVSHGRADLLLSGGSSPKSIYQDLSHVSLDWNRVLVGQVDERWVGLDSPGSNGAFIRRTLLKNQARDAAFTRMKSRHATAARGRDSLENEYARFNLTKSFAVLGMGTDGHIAGWFPDSEGLNQAVNPNNPERIAVIQANQSPVTGPYLERITLTLSALAKCSQLLLLIKGGDKRAVLSKALSSRSEQFPISHLLDAASDRLTIMQAG